jgi:hypothetical protein
MKPSMPRILSITVEPICDGHKFAVSEEVNRMIQRRSCVRQSGDCARGQGLGIATRRFIDRVGDHPLRWPGYELSTFSWSPQSRPTIIEANAGCTGRLPGILSFSVAQGVDSPALVNRLIYWIMNPT